MKNRKQDSNSTIKSAEVSTENIKIPSFIRRKLLLLFAFLLIFTITGCGTITEELVARKQQKENKAIMVERIIDMGDYIEAYLENKYEEDFQNGGIVKISNDKTTPEYAYVKFNFRSNDTGIYFQPAYFGKYAIPDFEVSIESGSISDSRYARKKRDELFIEHDKEKIDEIFPGYKHNYNTWTALEINFSNMQNRQVDTIDSKYFDIGYLIKNEEDILDSYYVQMNYFGNVYPENKDEMIEAVYDFLMYTRSMGFKRTQLDMNIYEDSLMDSKEYKEFDGGDLGSDMRISGMRVVSIEITYDESKKVETLEDLQELIVFREYTGDEYIKW